MENITLYKQNLTLGHQNYYEQSLPLFILFGFIKLCYNA